MTQREQCIGKDPLCPCQDGDACHYKGKDAWPVPAQAADHIVDANKMAAMEPAQHFPFKPWSKEAEMMESWAQHKAVEPVAWIRKHPDGTYSNELLCAWQIEKVRRESGAWTPLYTSPPDDLKFRPDWSGIEVLGAELHEAQKAIRLALEAMKKRHALTAGEYAAAIAALEKSLN